MKARVLFSTVVLGAVLTATTATSMAVPPPRRPLPPVPAVNDVAVAVQRRLARLGYYHGAIDGDVGPHTRSAIRRYQASHGLPITGTIDRPLRRSLGV